MPMSFVATPITELSFALNSTSLAANPGYTSTPSSSALSPSHLVNSFKLMIKLPWLFICGGAGIGMALFFVKKRILSFVAGVTFSKRDGLSGEFQSGMSSLTADGSMTLPERTCAPNSPPFSSTSTRNSSLPASLASCFRRMAALSPAGPTRISVVVTVPKVVDKYRHRRCRHQPHRSPALAASDRTNRRHLQASAMVLWQMPSCCSREHLTSAFRINNAAGPEQSANMLQW